MNRWSAVASLLSVFLFTCGCGGGTSGAAIGSSSGPADISAITGPTYLQAGVQSPSTYVYSASVSGASDTGVVWSVDDASLATIDASGVVTPSTSHTGRVTITAAAHADPSKKATLSVDVVDWLLADSEAQIVHSDGSSAGHLFNVGSLDKDCSWSHDHLKFICSDYSASTYAEVDTFTTDGTLAGTRQTAKLDFSNYVGLSWTGYPHFSPDGSQIVFEASGLLPYTLTFFSGPVVTDTAGKTQPNLLHYSEKFRDPTFSAPRFTPDGKRVIYADSGGLWIVDANGNNNQNLAPSPASQGVFSPDMSALYYASGGCLFKAKSDGSSAVCMLQGVDAMMDVSPNGALIAYKRAGTIFVANADGTNAQQTNGQGYASW